MNGKALLCRAFFVVEGKYKYVSDSYIKEWIEDYPSASSR